MKNSILNNLCEDIRNHSVILMSDNKKEEMIKILNSVPNIKIKIESFDEDDTNLIPSVAINITDSMDNYVAYVGYFGDIIDHLDFNENYSIKNESNSDV